MDRQDIILKNKARKSKARNRRLAYLEKHLKSTGYFDDEAIRLRDPLLYHTYIGKYITHEEKYPEFAPDMGLVERVYYGVDAREAQDRLEVVEEEQLSSEHDSSSEESDSDDVEQISGHEKETMRQELQRILHEKFIDGDDPDFDYSVIDKEEIWDNESAEEKDLHDRYFEDESDQEEHASGTGIYDY